MSEKLGFTFYPKDWWTSDTFFELDFTERAIFLECMFMMYQNDGYMKTKKSSFESRNRVKVSDKQWKNVTDNFILTEAGYTLVSVNKRLKKAIANRKNGLKGGRPSEKSIQNGEPKEPSLETQKNPPSERESEREEEIESEGEIQTANPRIFTTTQLSKIEIGENELTLLACRRSKKTVDQVKALFLDFVTLNKAVKKVWGSETDAKSHFLNWIGKQGSSPKVDYNF